jgi:hypothetical protein
MPDSRGLGSRSINRILARRQDLRNTVSAQRGGVNKDAVGIFDEKVRIYGEKELA